MELYIAICCDRHIDEVVRVYTTPEKAIQYCKDFVPERYELKEALTDSMERANWLYFASYGTEGDSVRVEKGVLDPQE